MKNIDQWKPTKFSFSCGKLSANTTSGNVSTSSQINVELLAESLSGIIPKGCKGKLLDLGCGKAPLYEAYSSLTNDITCADWPNSSHQLTHIDLACDISKNLPFASRSFNSIVITDVLEHIKDPSHLLAEIYRTLAPGGKVVGTVPFMYWIHEEPHDYFRYTEHGIRSLAVNNGFSVDLIEPYGGSTDSLFDLAAKISIDIHWRFGPIIASFFVKTARFFRRTNFYRMNINILTKTPIGYTFLLSKN